MTALWSQAQVDDVQPQAEPRSCPQVALDPTLSPGLDTNRALTLTTLHPDPHLRLSLALRGRRVGWSHGGAGWWVRWSQATEMAW